MKKVLIVMAVSVLAVVLIGVMACSKGKTGTTPTAAATQFALVDDFAGNAGQSDGTAFGGYWYTYDDITNQDTVGGACGDSQVVPMSANADAAFSYGATPLPAFVVAVPNVTPVGASFGYYLRVSGVVDRAKTPAAYQYGFAGFGVNLLPVDAITGNKVPVNASTLGYKRLTFWYRNGPNVTTPIPMKVGMATSFQPSGAACAMTANDNIPLVDFTSNTYWAKFDQPLSAFAPESTWLHEITGSGCPARGTQSTCSILTTIPTSIAYVGGAQFSCTAAEAMTALVGLQWQSNFCSACTATTTHTYYPFDVEIAYVTFSE